MLPRDYVRLDEEQFAKLVELLTPGYELAKAYMAEMEARKAAMEARETEHQAVRKAAHAESEKHEQSSEDENEDE